MESKAIQSCDDSLEYNTLGVKVLQNTYSGTYCSQTCTCTCIKLSSTVKRVCAIGEKLLKFMRQLYSSSCTTTLTYTHARTHIHTQCHVAFLPLSSRHHVVSVPLPLSLPFSSAPSPPSRTSSSRSVPLSSAAWPLAEYCSPPC